MEFKVTLINKEDFERKNLFTRIGEFACICYNTPLSKAETVGKHCVKSGHLSGSRHVYYAFHLDSIRSVNDQLVRHQDGVVKNMQSQRYVNKSNFDYYTSSDIEANPQAKEKYDAAMKVIQEAYNDITSILAEVGLHGEQANEQARGVLPMDVESKLALALNIEGLIHLAHKRLCLRTQEHTRKIVGMIIDEVLKVSPELKEYLVPQCEAMFYCPENHKGCPRMKSGHMINKDELKRITDDARKHRMNKAEIVLESKL